MLDPLGPAMADHGRLWLAMTHVKLGPDMAGLGEPWLAKTEVVTTTWPTAFWLPTPPLVQLCGSATAFWPHMHGQAAQAMRARAAFVRAAMASQITRSEGVRFNSMHPAAQHRPRKVAEH